MRLHTLLYRVLKFDNNVKFIYNDFINFRGIFHHCFEHCYDFDKYSIRIMNYLNCTNKRFKCLKIKRNRTVARKLSTWVCLEDKAGESREARGRYMFRRSSNFRRSAGSSRDFAKRSLRKKRSTRLRTLPVRDEYIIPRNCRISVPHDQRRL